MMTTRMPRPWDEEQTLENLLSHRSQMLSLILLPRTDPVYQVHTFPRMQAPDHPTLLEMYHGNTLLTTPTPITMPPFELLLQHFYPSALQLLAVCPNETKLPQP
jgi:hypothetical protein